MIARPLFIMILCLISFSPLHASHTLTIESASQIKNYQPIFMPVYDSNKKLKIAIRSYEKAKTHYLLVVDSDTLTTQVIAANTAKSFLSNQKAKMPDSLKKTPYVQALYRYTAPPYKLHNHGAIAALYKTKDVFLTIDMCPSSKH